VSLRRILGAYLKNICKIEENKEQQKKYKEKALGKQ
jgi:hypothetical protein